MSELRPFHRHLLLALVLLVIVGAIFALENQGTESTVPPPPDDLPAELANARGAPNFQGATDWLNTEGPIDIVDLRGRVVLVDFWTYSCVNCIRTFPHLNAWHDAYAGRGLVIVGVHSPEFRFERERDNVEEATQRHGIDHAVALDNDFSIWNAYHNRFWPAKYLVDPYGKIRYTHFGEGAYRETENQIRTLLVEAGFEPGPGANATDETSGGRHSPELYAGAAQGPSRVAIGNKEGYHPGQTIEYAQPGTISPDKIYLVGKWYNDDDHVWAEADAQVLLRFQGGGANFVADGPNQECVQVWLDNNTIPEDRAGNDVSFADDIPCVRLDGARSYDFYAGPNEQHDLELRVPQGFHLYTFAFSSTPTT